MRKQLETVPTVNLQQGNVRQETLLKYIPILYIVQTGISSAAYVTRLDLLGMNKGNSIASHRIDIAEYTNQRAKAAYVLQNTGACCKVYSQVAKYLGGKVQSR